MQAFVFANQQVQQNLFQQQSLASRDPVKTMDQATFEQLLSERLHPEHKLFKQWIHLPRSVKKQLAQLLENNNFEGAKEELRQRLELMELEQLAFQGDKNVAQEKMNFGLDEWLVFIFAQQQIEDRASLSEETLPILDVDQLKNEQQVDETKTMSQFNHLLLEVQTLLKSLSTEADIATIAPKLLQLLEEWTAISDNTNHFIRQPFQQQDEERVNDLWRALLQTYQNRATFNAKQLYPTEAEVTAKDVAKWLKQLLAQQTQVTQPNSSLPQVNITNTPVSNIEHYMLHIHQTNVKSVETQFLEQFQQIIRTSQLLTNPNGHQLVITLQPENLGDLVVRLTEMNGELTLKIITSSQVTRQMLEANIHELRTMFAPHQVTIERQDIELNHLQQQLEEEFVNEQEQDQSEEQQEQENESDHNKFTETLTSLLNKKV